MSDSLSVTLKNQLSELERVSQLVDELKYKC
jgi:hypothetical protein